MSIWTAVHGLADGEKANATVLNRPVWELRERTDYIYNLLNQYSGNNPFEAINISELEVETEGEYAPAVKDIVYLDPETHKLKKAIATIDVFNNIFSSASAHSLAIGVLKSLTGTSGTVSIGGRIYLSDIGGSWAVTDMLETDEEFRAGHYYLSSTEAGKLTANPKGPAIYIGQFLSQIADPTLFDYAILQPQYKDVAESHIHRSIALATQPAGYQTYGDDPFTDVHAITGFRPTSAADVTDGTHDTGAASATLVDSTATFIASNLVGLTLYNVTKGTSSVITANTVNTIDTSVSLSWDVGNTYKIEERNRLIIKGPYTDLNAYQYTFTLAGLDILNPPISGTPDQFDSVYLHWSSTDPNEEDGYVRVRSYETELTVGSKGLKAVLEPVIPDSAIATGYNVVETGPIARRQWVLDVPAQTKGWLANKQRGYFTSNFISTNQGYSLLVMGGPHSSADQRLTDDITVKAAHLYKIDYGTNLPSDGDTVTVAGIVFEFDDDETLASVDNISVSIVAGDYDATFLDLVNAINVREIPGTSAALSETNGHVIIGTADASTVSTTMLAPITLTEVLAPAAWAIDGTNGFMVYDKNNMALAPVGSFWSNAEYWEPLDLSNGLSLMFIPYDSAGVACISDDVTNGDYWVKSITDEAPNANFVYNVAMHDEVNQIHPPIPYDCGLLVLNGIQLENSAVYDTDLTYRFGNSGIYWYSNSIGNVPWPRDWASVDSPGSPEYQQYLIYNNVRMSVGDTSVVTSLHAAPNSPIRIYQCGTTSPGSVGALSLDVDLQLAEEDTNMEGYKVYKDIQDNKLVKGPVVSKIEAGPGIEITSPPGVPNGQGKVKIGLASATDLTGDFEEVALRNAKQEMIGMYPFIKLLPWTTGASNIATGFTAKFKVPINVVGNHKVVIYLTLFGDTDIELPVGVTPHIKYAGLEFSYSVLHDYMNPVALNSYDNLLDDLITPANVLSVEVPMGSTTVDVNYPNYLYKAYDPVVIHNNPSEPIVATRRITQSLGDEIPTITDIQRGSTIAEEFAYVCAGSLFAMQIKRAGVDDPTHEYTGGLGFINMRWKLV